MRIGLGVLVFATSIALTSSWALAAPPAPVAPKLEEKPAAAPAGSTSFDFTTTGTTGEKMLRAAQVMAHSPKRKDRHTDWAAAKKYFAEHTTWRDDFAAGYQGAGGTLDNAAQSTKDRLKDRYDDFIASVSTSSAQTPGKAEAQAKAGGSNCTGTTKDVAYSKDTGRSEVWLDSCDTTDLIARWSGCSLALGWVSSRVKGWWSAIPGFFAMVCGQKALAPGAAKANSSVAAIKYYFTRVTRVGGNGLVDGQVRITVTLYSQ